VFFVIFVITKYCTLIFFLALCPPSCEEVYLTLFLDFVPFSCIWDCILHGVI